MGLAPTSMMGASGSSLKAMINEPKKTTSRRKPAASTSKASPVYFLSLTVERVLCFKDRQVLDLSDGKGNPAQWTVILGNNGVGKTTLLRCLAGMEFQEEFCYVDDRGESWGTPLIGGDYSDPLSMWHELEVMEKYAAQIDAQVADNALLSSVRMTGNIGKRNQPKFQKDEIKVSVGYEPTLYPLQQLRGLICYGYGATRRMGDASLSESLASESSESLFSDTALLLNAEEWLLQTDYAARSASGTMRDRFNNQLNQIIEVLKRILPEIEDIRIAPADEDRPRPRAEFLTPYG
ncbi:MAG: ATP-binding cassette domain-containing protein, partial [Leptolyngbyaceae bacterium]|nr:ATP-binding cassette domain-containing protein [Leptolyngbyaceae bacterium]